MDIVLGESALFLVLMIAVRRDVQVEKKNVLVFVAAGAFVCRKHILFSLIILRKTLYIVHKFEHSAYKYFWCSKDSFTGNIQLQLKFPRIKILLLPFWVLTFCKTVEYGIASLYSASESKYHLGFQSVCPSIFAFYCRQTF